MKKKSIASLLLSIVVLAGCTTVKTEPVDCTADNTCQETEKKEEGPELQEITIDQAIQYFEDGSTGLMFFGFTDCPWCQQARPVLAQALEEAGYDQPVLYVRTRDDDHNRLYDDKQKEEIIPYIGEYMDENSDGELVIFVPLFLHVQDGKVIAGHLSTVDGHDAPEREMTEEEKAQLKQIYLDVIQAQPAVSD